MGKKLKNRNLHENNLVEGVPEAADELAARILRDPLSTTQYLADLCAKYGTLRPVNLRTEVKKALARSDSLVRKKFPNKDLLNKNYSGFGAHLCLGFLPKRLGALLNRNEDGRD